MNVTFNELFESFKGLEEVEKKQAIISFLKQNIEAMKKLNEQLGITGGSEDMNLISNSNPEQLLDAIYQLIHLLTEEMELYVEKIANTYYE